MKKIMSILGAMLVFAAVVVAEPLTVASFKGNSQFMPAVTAILEGAGYEVKPVIYDEQGQLIAALTKNEVDVAFFLAQPIITQAKAQFISARLMNTDFCAVTTDPSIVIKSTADLKKYKVCVMKGQPGQNAAVRGCLDVVEVASEIEQFKTLKEGGAQVVVSVRDLIVPMSRAAGLANPIVCEPPVMKNPTFLAVSGKSSDKKAELDTLFQKALSDGSWGKELAKLKK